MNFAISLSTNSRFVGLIPVPDPILPPEDPMASILKALGAKLDELGCPRCCSGFPLTFIKESGDFGGGDTIIGNEFKLKRVTRLNNDFVLAEGANGGVINIGEISPGETIDVEELAPEAARIALLVGRKEVMKNFEALASTLPQLKEKLGSFDAIGFAEFPLVARTNDPLIT